MLVPQTDRRPKRQGTTQPEVPTTRELQAEIARLKRQIADNAAAIANAPLRKSSMTAPANSPTTHERGGADVYRALAQAKGGQEQALWEEPEAPAPVVRKIGADKERKP